MERGVVGRQAAGANDTIRGVNRNAITDHFSLDDAQMVTRMIMHDYHLEGSTFLWESMLCEQTVWLGSGETMLFGGATIRDHFREFVQFGTADILREEYHTLPRIGGMAVVFGKLITRLREGERRGQRYRTMFSCCYAMVDGSLKLLVQHYTFEWQGVGLPSDVIDKARRARGSGQTVASAAVAPAPTTRQAARDGAPTWSSPQMRAAAFLVARNLSVSESDAQRIPLHSDSQMIYIDPRTLLYAESRNHRCEVVTLTKAFTCTVTLGELTSMLPEYCCRVHRGYLINAHYIAAIRRSEVELASGVVIPIPAPKYAATKQHLTELIAGFDAQGQAQRVNTTGLED